METPPLNTEYFELEPFIHQVGGHSFMLSLDGATVCKPLVQREFQFYQTIPEGVEKFMPRFYGIVSVKILQTDDGYIKFIAIPPTDYVPIPSGNKNKFRVRRTGSIELTNPTEEEVFQEDQDDATDMDAPSAAVLNPWVLKCHRENMCTLLESFQRENSDGKQFLLLENLAWKFTYPCILDLKMGTRQYGDAATLAKKQSKMYKVVSTTSAKLGLRVGGMQVYQIRNKHYLCRNKFYGRKLTVNSFQQALVQFLHNGVRFRSDVLPILIRRLEELSDVLERQETIRLYTSSLLLLYEGDDPEPEVQTDRTLKRLDSLRLHDSDNLRKQESLKLLHIPGESDPLRKTSSAECLNSFERDVARKGLPYLRRRSSTATFDSTKSGSPSLSSNASSSDSTIFEDCSDVVRHNNKTLAESLARSLSTKSDSSSVGGGGSGSPEPNVDVKMIDFAHSTHKALDDPVVYSGPDLGFLFGLEKLIAMLKSIESDYG